MTYPAFTVIVEAVAAVARHRGEHTGVRGQADGELLDHAVDLSRGVPNTFRYGAAVKIPVTME